MIRITIGKKKYKGVYSWNDITLERFSQLASIPMPEGYEAFIRADGKFSIENLDQWLDEVSKLTDKQLKEDFPEYYRQVVNCLTNIPAKTIRTMTDEQIGEVYEYYFKPFVLSIIYHTPVMYFLGQFTDYTPESIKKFRIGLHWYHVPKSLVYQGQEFPLADESIMTYSDASDIFRDMKMSQGDVNRLALFMAIYCRRKGEEYNDRIALERHEKFKKLPMSVVWSVFFYTLRRLHFSMIIIKLFGDLPHQITETVQRSLILRGSEITV